MEKPIYINFNKTPSPTTLLFLPKLKPLELGFGRKSERIFVEVTSFPTFKKVTLEDSHVGVQASVRLNTFEWRLITETDPFIVAVDMDNKTLREIDIKENTNIYNIN